MYVSAPTGVIYIVIHTPLFIFPLGLVTRIVRALPLTTAPSTNVLSSASLSQRGASASSPLMENLNLWGEPWCITCTCTMWEPWASCTVQCICYVVTKTRHLRVAGRVAVLLMYVWSVWIGWGTQLSCIEAYKIIGNGRHNHLYSAVCQTECIQIVHC